MELNNDRLTSLSAFFEATWLDLKIEMAFSVIVQLKYSLRCWVMCPRCIQYIYISNYETACRYEVCICYALRYVLDLCAIYI